MKTKLIICALTALFGITSDAISAEVIWLEPLGRALDPRYAWGSKGHGACQYFSSGSEYRTWKPDVSRTPEGGYFVSTKIDHIRNGPKVGPIKVGGAGDDHCQLEMEFDASKKIIKSSLVMEFEKGNKKFDTSIVTSLTKDPRAKAAAEAFDKLADQVARWSEDGGRRNFPAVVKRNFNEIVQWVANDVKKPSQ